MKQPISRRAKRVYKANARSSARVRKTPLMVLCEQLQQLSRRVPQADWEQFPPDFITELDKYV